MNEFSRSVYAVLSVFLIGFILMLAKNNSSSSEITEGEIMNHIRYLSHENRTGRLPGTRGSKDAIAYIVKNFKSFGLKPGVNGSYIQPFDIQTGIRLGKQNILIKLGLPKEIAQKNGIVNFKRVPASNIIPCS